MTKKLTVEQHAELKQLHRQEPHRRFADRIKTILLLDSGWSYSKIAEALLLDDQTIRNYEMIYSRGGISAVLKTDYKGGSPKLSVEQEIALKDHIVNNTYSSSAAIVEYVKQTYAILVFQLWNGPFA